MWRLIHLQAAKKSALQVASLIFAELGTAQTQLVAAFVMPDSMRICDGRQSLMEVDIQCKMTFEGICMGDIFIWRTIFDKRQALLEDTLQLIENNPKSMQNNL